MASPTPIPRLLNVDDASSLPRRPTARRWWQSPWLDALIFAALVGSLAWLTVRGAAAMDYRWQWYRIPRYFYRVIDGEVVWGPLTRGLLLTLEISFYSAIIALAIGLSVALLRLSSSWAGHFLATMYLEIIRNTPFLVQMLLFYFLLAPILGLDRFWVGVLALACFEGAFASETLRGALIAVPLGQHEASHSLGLSTYQRYRLILLPQALPLMLPPLTGSLVNLVKNSAMVSVIALADLTTEGRNLIADTFMSFEVWLTVAALYLAITIPLSYSVRLLEKRSRRFTRPS